MKNIDIKQLQPDGVTENIRRLREEDMKRYLDEAGGKLKADLIERVNCAICQQDNTEPLFEKEGFNFVKCRNCGLVYVNPRLASEKISDFYNAKRFDYIFGSLYIKSAPYRQATLYQERLDYIEKYLPIGKLLDVGSGAGHFVESAERRGWDASGVEVSKKAADYAKTILKLEKIFNATLNNARLADDYFDAATCWDTMEHLSAPLDTLKEIHRVLKPQGMIFISVPNFDSAEFMLFGPDCDTIMADAHLTYFTPQTLRLMLEKSGFEIVFEKVEGIDIDHAITNIKNVYHNNYDTKFLEDKKIILQEIIDLAGKGNYIFMFARKS